MATKVIKTTFKVRRGLADTWKKQNPVLAYGEPGFEKDTYKLKIGDGTTEWNLLPYVNAEDYTELKKYIDNSDKQLQTQIDQLSTNIQTLNQQLIKLNELLGAPATAEIDATGLFKQVAQNTQSIQALLEGAPKELDTLKEVADWIAKDDAEDAIVRIAIGGAPTREDRVTTMRRARVISIPRVRTSTTATCLINCITSFTATVCRTIRIYIFCG